MRIWIFIFFYLLYLSFLIFLSVSSISFFSFYIFLLYFFFLYFFVIFFLFIFFYIFFYFFFKFFFFNFFVPIQIHWYSIRIIYNLRKVQFLNINILPFFDTNIFWSVLAFQLFFLFSSSCFLVLNLRQEVYTNTYNFLVNTFLWFCFNVIELQWCLHCTSLFSFFCGYYFFFW